MANNANDDSFNKGYNAYIIDNIFSITVITEITNSTRVPLILILKKKRQNRLTPLLTATETITPSTTPNDNGNYYS